MSWISDQLVRNKDLVAVCASSGVGHAITADPKDHVQPSITVPLFTGESCNRSDYSGMGDFVVYNGTCVLFLARKIIVNDP